ncbi:MATE family efflux transporter [Fervidobacterium thailandense]|uniref:Multidrug transporter MATE n=1 Tax=Fervidobacterium thailandense TaxID=1008305 RepID=A0A1E3G409_9BACT|nr:MATE family efflux transporter [Fervidobacterium thailandense]ODN30994.1 multidrug transporter MATE [Fervidobacterium thailandense]
MLKNVLRIAIPVSVENILGNTGIFLMTLMLTKLGEVPVAVNGIAAQASFLVILFLFGLNSGGGIFLAQFWGKKDYEGISRTTSLMVLFSLVISTIFFVLTFFFPTFFAGIFSKDPTVVKESFEFLRIISFSYFGIALEVVFRTLLRSVERATIPMESYIFGTTVQVGLAYVLTFGHFGFPKLGLMGIAWATLVGRYLIPAYQILRIVFSDLKFSFFNPGVPRSFLRKFLSYATPTTLNEIAWSLGMTMYGVIFGRMGTKVYAARNVLSSFENYVWTFTFGLVIAAAVLVGKMIGEMRYQEALQFAKRMLKVNVLVGTVSAGLILLVYYVLLPGFKLELETKRMLTFAMWVMLIGAPIKAFNGMAVVGVLRAGGDAKFAFLLESSTLWLIGVPLAYIGAFVWNLDMPVVYALTLSDELVKSILAYLRIKSNSWMRNVTLEEPTVLVEHEV